MVVHLLYTYNLIYFSGNQEEKGDKMNAEDGDTQGKKVMIRGIRVFWFIEAIGLLGY